jgi:hypothetical protein
MIYISFNFYLRECESFNGKILPGSTLTRQNFYTLTILQQIQKFP